MREVLVDVDRWLAAGERVALATVVQTWGSAPRKVGAKMAMTPAGAMSGSVSGGCVEGAVYEAGLAVLATNQPQLLSFGVADETAWEVGLACGGKIRVFVEALNAGGYGLVRDLVKDDRPVAVATLVSGENSGGRLVVDSSGVVADGVPAGLAEQIAALSQTALAEGQHQRHKLANGQELFIDVNLPAYTLIIVGGVHIAITLAKMATLLDYRTVIIDPRRAFGSVERFPHADQLIQAWPKKALAQLNITSSTAVVMLTHDPKIDDPALLVSLSSSAFYVGALGSRRTQAKRYERLLAGGVPAGQLDRIHAPIGLNINAQTPEEIGLAIMAEIVATRRANQLRG